MSEDKNDNSNGSDDNRTLPPSGVAVKMLTKDELAKLRNEQPLQESWENGSAQCFQPTAQMENLEKYIEHTFQLN